MESSEKMQECFVVVGVVVVFVVVMVEEEEKAASEQPLQQVAEKPQKNRRRCQLPYEFNILHSLQFNMQFVPEYIAIKTLCLNSYKS